MIWTDFNSLSPLYFSLLLLLLFLAISHETMTHEVLLYYYHNMDIS